jgi:hypothetical protein
MRHALTGSVVALLVAAGLVSAQPVGGSYPAGYGPPVWPVALPYDPQRAGLMAAALDGFQELPPAPPPVDRSGMATPAYPPFEAPPAGPAPEPPPVSLPDATPPPAPEDHHEEEPAPSCCAPPAERVPRLWASGEYLLWWFKDAPLPVPLVTTGGSDGVLGSPGVQIADGGSKGVGFQTESGYRFSIGLANCTSVLGLEATGFYFPRETNTVTFGSNGSATIARPVLNLATGGQTSLLVAEPNAFAGTVQVQASTTLGGGELNGILNLGNAECKGLDFIFGFRYLDLDDRLDIQQSSTPIGTGVGTLNPAILLPGPGSIRDSFHTRNEFAGGQVGLQREARWGKFYMFLTAKAALGGTHEMMDVLGASGVGTPGGLLATPSNSGHYIRDEFTVVPEGELTLGYQVTNNIRLYAGYSFLYWSSVIRPGDLLNSGINPVEVPSSSSFTGAVPGQPARQNNQTDFWAQGFNFGLALRY